MDKHDLIVAQYQQWLADSQLQIANLAAENHQLKATVQELQEKPAEV